MLKILRTEDENLVCSFDDVQPLKPPLITNTCGHDAPRLIVLQELLHKLPACAGTKHDFDRRLLQHALRTLLKPLLERSLAMALDRPLLRSSSRMLVPLFTFFSAAIESTVT